VVFSILSGPLILSGKLSLSYLIRAPQQAIQVSGGVQKARVVEPADSFTVDEFLRHGSAARQALHLGYCLAKINASCQSGTSARCSRPRNPGHWVLAASNFGFSVADFKKKPTKPIVCD